MKFEQSKEVSAQVYKTDIQVMTTIYLVMGHFFGAFMLLMLWGKSSDGQHVSVWEWVCASLFGIIVAGVARVGMHFGMVRRRFIHFTDQGLRMSEQPTIAYNRFVSWSITPSSHKPGYSKVTLRFKALWLNPWNMWLADDSQIAELKKALRTHLPNAKEIEPGALPRRNV